jgi:hypothetical protein
MSIREAWIRSFQTPREWSFLHLSHGTKTLVSPFSFFYAPTIVPFAPPIAPDDTGNAAQAGRHLRGACAMFLARQFIRPKIYPA